MKGMKIGTGTLAVPKFILPNFGNFLRRHLASGEKKLQFLFSEKLGKVVPAGSW